jgi:hypothetical protein
MRIGYVQCCSHIFDKTKPVHTTASHRGRTVVVYCEQCNVDADQIPKRLQVLSPEEARHRGIPLLTPRRFRHGPRRIRRNYLAPLKDQPSAA